MSIAEIKQQLHKYIDVANDTDIEAVFSFIEDRGEHAHAFTDEEISEFYRRRDAFLKGGNKGYSVEEVHNYLRSGRSAL